MYCGYKDSKTADNCVVNNNCSAPNCTEKDNYCFCVYGGVN